MALHLYWFIPGHGDGRDVARDGAANVRRDPDAGYLAQVARAAEQAGFTGALVPFGLFCEDPWLVAAALSRETARLRFMVAFRPGTASPTLTAQMAATCQRLTGGRLLLNVVSGGDPEELRRYGDHLGHDERYARAGEFLSVLRGAWTGSVDHEGEHYRVSGATVIRRPDPLPPIFLGGSSEPALRTAIRHADVYLAWGEPPDRMAAQVARVRAEAAAAGRALPFGTRMHVISRDTSDEAWAEADRIVAGMSDGLVERSQRRFAASDSEGQRRMAALHGGSRDGLEVHPNVWTGYGLGRQGPALALVGSHEEVADRIAEYHELGVDHLILSAQPHLEEAYRLGEGLVPQLRRRGLLAAPEDDIAPARPPLAAGTLR
ncbi:MULTISPECIES: LLM class flavin-dependent oxidoreductase [Amycolatopsis]|uniref:LLM class flavin-dependent oxidoreductase n=1 Tax=Amycolatopsis albidoflavus TaxID=102226 RepID=A0ABW5I6K5_9PSEU